MREDKNSSINVKQVSLKIKKFAFLHTVNSIKCFSFHQQNLTAPEFLEPLKRWFNARDKLVV